jgi:hypothetical protein
MEDSQPGHGLNNSRADASVSPQPQIVIDARAATRLRPDIGRV